MHAPPCGWVFGSVFPLELARSTCAVSLIAGCLPMKWQQRNLDIGQPNATPDCDDFTTGRNRVPPAGWILFKGRSHRLMRI
jgi:hypothetical protein